MPFKLTQTPPKGSMKYYLSTVHWLDAIDPPLEERIDELAVMIEAVLKDDAAPPYLTAAHGSGAQRVAEGARNQSAPGIRKKIWLLSAAGVLELAAILWSTGALSRPTPTTAPSVTDQPASETAEKLYQKAQQHHQGNGVEQSYEKAAEYYRSAADQGNIYAQYSLGWLYETGAGVEQSCETAAEYYRLVADQGLAVAIEALEKLNGSHVLKDE